MKDRFNSSKILGGIAAQAAKADVGSGNIDRAGFESVLVAINMGAEGITLSGDDYIQVKLEHGDSTSAYESVGAADVVGVTPASGIVAKYDAAAEAPAQALLGYIGGKRYLKVTVDYVGTHATETPIGVTVLGGDAVYQPVV